MIAQVRITAVAALAVAASAISARAQSPTVEGPVGGGNGTPVIAATAFDLAEVGYGQEEYFISGTARAYTSSGALASDGRWTVTPGASAPYKTRILVYRPIDPGRFNGTVFVEWLNVTGGLDAAADWLTGHTELIREGCAWVGVSAQFIGVEGGPPIGGLPSTPLKPTDPVRYGSLAHPGDNFSYDIFSQAGLAVRVPTGIRPLGDLAIEHVIAMGESQSAFRMVTYIDAIHPQAGIYDGFLVHSRNGGAAPLSQAPGPAVNTPTPTFIRDDLDVPVLTFQTETDVTGLGFFVARQADTDRFRLWEVAGTAHADVYTVSVGMTDRGDSPVAAELVVTAMPLPFFTCDGPINSGPQHFVFNAAVHAIGDWVRRGSAPPRAPRLDLVTEPATGIARDARGNALGGVRTPQVDVPLAAFSGEAQSGSLFCILFGKTEPFGADTLSALYPNHRFYVAAVKRSARRAVREGFLRAEDARLIKAAADLASVGSGSAATTGSRHR